MPLHLGDVEEFLELFRIFRSNAPVSPNLELLIGEVLNVISHSHVWE